MKSQKSTDSGAGSAALPPRWQSELDEKVLELDSKLDWEIGPGSTEPWQRVISPSLDRDLWQKARGIVARAPVIEGWKFHSARTAKDWITSLR